jgi:hypothetical protein
MCALRCAGDAGAQLLAARCGALRALSLRGCIGVTDATLRALASHPAANDNRHAHPSPPLPCPALAELDVAHTRVTRAGVAALRAARPALRVTFFTAAAAPDGADSSSSSDGDDGA